MIMNNKPKKKSGNIQLGERETGWSLLPRQVGVWKENVRVAEAWSLHIVGNGEYEGKKKRRKWEAHEREFQAG